MSTIAAPSKVTPPQTAPSKTPSAKRLLRVREAAEYLSISAWRVRELVRDGLLPVVQPRTEERGAWTCATSTASLSGTRQRNPYK